jgi:hypothetical protein
VSKSIHLTDATGTDLSESYVALADDVLTLLHPLLAASQAPEAWMLFRDFYGDAAFDTDGAQRLAEQCLELAAAAGPVAAVWLRVVAALATAAADSGLHVRAVAD